MDYRIEKFSLDELADEKLFRHWVLSLKKINNSYFHPKISEFNDNFQENKKMSKYSYLEGMPLHLKIEQEKKFGITMHYTQSSKKNLLEIKTSEKMLKKAYLIATQLIVGIEKLGGTLTNSWQSEIVKLELSPLKFRFIITELTKRRSLIQEGSMKPAYGRVSSGELKLEIKFDSGEKSYIYATKDISFNQQLEDIFGTIRGEYLLLRDKELEQRIAKDLENKKRLLLEDNQKLEEEKVRLQKEISESQISLKQDVFSHMKKLEELLEIKTYTDKLRQVYLDYEPLDKVERYVDIVNGLYDFKKFVEELDRWSNEVAEVDDNI